MSAPDLTIKIDTQNVPRINTIYAGDIQGKLWKVDASTWKSGSFTTSASLLFDAGNTQPITARPTALTNPDGGYTVLFGTGSYVKSTDLTLPQQRFYGIWDKSGSNVTITLTNLLQQSFNTLVSQTTGDKRLVATSSQNTFDKTKHLGWYINLPDTNERVVAPALTYSKNGVLFTSLVPQQQACGSSLTSYLMLLDAFSGVRTTIQWDTNGDGTIDNSDLIGAKNDTNVSRQTTGGNGQPFSIVGSTVVQNCATGKCVAATALKPPATTLQQTWRQLFF